MTDGLPPLDDILGRKVHVDGHEWTFRYSEATKRFVLERPVPGSFDVLLKALREGAAVLETDPAAVAGQPLPTEREPAEREWLFLDAVIQGGRANDALAPEAIGLLEARLAQLTAFLSVRPGR